MIPIRLVSVNVAHAQPVTINGRRVMTAIGKRPVEGEVAVGPLGLAGDEQADPTVHGGHAKAVYAYPFDHYPFWQTVRAQARVSLWDEPLPHGLLGENLTIAGLREVDVWIGDRLCLPDCELVVTEPRMPCFKLAAAMGFPAAVKLMADAGFSGFYLGVAREGSVKAGQTGELVPGPRELALRDLFRSRSSHLRR